MKSILRIILVTAFCLAAASTIFAQRQHNHPFAAIGGVYGGFTANPQSGDLDGMRVAIFAAGGAWHAIVQIAGGGAEDPAPHYVDVTVTGNKVEFKVDDNTYIGTVSAAGLKLKDEGLLKRKNPATFFMYGP
jgi:hypothetical protein